ncbi:MAG: adenylosuccinate synthetase [Rhodospirillales bacterium]|nr:adenylosuccinate synthetase [Rhodospirillales bacterium]
MPVTVIVGGQFGSEGKGKVAHEFARMRGAAVAVRTGGSNSGHTVIDPGGKPRIFRHLPTAAILDDVTCAIGAGSYLDAEVLLGEIAETKLGTDRLLIDPNAVIISDQHKQDERAERLSERIGSTGSGTGAAVADRVRRTGTLRFARDDERLRPWTDRAVAPYLRERLRKNQRVILEGTQGFGLSLLHSGYYPHVTSRDTTAAAFVAEAGLSPLDVDEIALVIRAFPIRVFGSQSGPLPHEISWDIVTQESGNLLPIRETTSVTNLVRRVGRFDSTIVKNAIAANTPTHIVINHLDYVQKLQNTATSLPPKARDFLLTVESDIGVRASFVGLGRSSLLPRHEATDFLCAL